MDKPNSPTDKVLGAVSTILSPLNPFTRNGGEESTARTKSVIRTQVHGGITWIDIENPTNADLSKLAEDYPLHPLHLHKGVLQQLPAVEKEKDYTFVLLYAAKYDPDQDKINTSQFGFFLGKNYLISLHDDSSTQLQPLFQACDKDKDISGAYFGKSSTHLLYTITTSLVDDLSGIAQSLVRQLDKIDDKVFDNEVSDAYVISRLRQKILRLKRITSSYKSVMSELAPIVNNIGKENLSRYFSNNAKNANKLLETIEEAKETIEIYKDADFTASTEKTNEILAVLTLIFTFTIPPTVIGTFFGMNILLPGGIETGPWLFLGKYTTLILIITLSILFVSAMFWYFKKKKWF